MSGFKSMRALTSYIKVFYHFTLNTILFDCLCGYINRTNNDVNASKTSITVAHKNPKNINFLCLMVENNI